MYNILIIDDEKAIRHSLRDVLELEDYTVFEAENGKVAIDMLKKQMFDLIFCDIKMPQMDGIEFISKAKELTNAPIIMISGHGTIATAVESLKKGAVDYIEKPLDLNKILSVARANINKNPQNISPQPHNQKTKKSINLAQTTIIGDSDVMKQMLKIVDKVAPTEAKVLITGANGTGKELVAKRIHEHSLRKDKPFVELNCAAIPNELLESELFGHKKGAFTTAISDQKGKFQLADGGTLFLDEVGDMSLSNQSKVLQAIQEKKILPVGSEKEVTVDVRILSATNKDLKKEIEKGNFREDLYHRLNVIEIKVPKLNDRREDIPQLVNYFLELSCKQENKKMPTIKKDAMKYLQNLDYTGNIRQLRNIVERLNILCDGEITLEKTQKYAL